MLHLEILAAAGSSVGCLSAIIYQALLDYRKRREKRRQKASDEAQVRAKAQSQLLLGVKSGSLPTALNQAACDQAVFRVKQKLHLVLLRGLEDGSLAEALGTAIPKEDGSLAGTLGTAIPEKDLLLGPFQKSRAEAYRSQGLANGSLGGALSSSTNLEAVSEERTDSNVATLNALVQLLETGDEDEKLYAATQLLENGQEDQKVCAATALGKLTSIPENQERIGSNIAALSGLMQLLKTGHDAGKQTAAEALGNLACNNMALKGMMQLLETGDDAGKRIAAEAAGKQDAERQELSAGSGGDQASGSSPGDLTTEASAAEENNGKKITQGPDFIDIRLPAWPGVKWSICVEASPYQIPTIIEASGVSQGYQSAEAESKKRHEIQASTPRSPSVRKFVRAIEASGELQYEFQAGARRAASPAPFPFPPVSSRPIPSLAVPSRQAETYEDSLPLQASPAQDATRSCSWMSSPDCAAGGNDANERSLSNIKCQMTQMPR